MTGSEKEPLTLHTSTVTEEFRADLGRELGHGEVTRDSERLDAYVTDTYWLALHAQAEGAPLGRPSSCPDYLLGRGAAGCACPSTACPGGLGVGSAHRGLGAGARRLVIDLTDPTGSSKSTNALPVTCEECDGTARERAERTRPDASSLPGSSRGPPWAATWRRADRRASTHTARSGPVLSLVWCSRGRVSESLPRTRRAGADPTLVGSEGTLVSHPGPCISFPCRSEALCHRALPSIGAGVLDPPALAVGSPSDSIYDDEAPAGAISRRWRALDGAHRLARGRAGTAAAGRGDAGLAHYAGATKRIPLCRDGTASESSSAPPTRAPLLGTIDWCPYARARRLRRCAPRKEPSPLDLRCMQSALRRGVRLITPLRGAGVCGDAARELPTASGRRLEPLLGAA